MPKIEIEIGADNSDLKKKIKEVEFDVKELAKVKVDRIKLGLDTTEITAQIKDTKATLTGLRGTLKDTGDSFTAMKPKVANGSNALMQFSRIAQDAPFGIMGIGNNITATTEAFGYLKQSTGSASGALKAMASSLLGSGGILLAVSLVTSAFTYMSMNGLTLSDVIDKITGKAQDLAKINLNKAFELDEVISATQNVSELTNEIQLAKDGFLDKDSVVKHYNETIGKTTGIVSSLDEAEQQLVKNGKAYIQMTLLKAAAQLASEDAAKQTLQAEKSRQKNLTEFSNAILDADLTQTRSKEQYDAKQANLQRQLIKRKKEEVKINIDAAKKNLDIAEKFNKQAAEISKGFNFNFFSDNEEAKKPKKALKPKKFVNKNPNFDGGNNFVGGGVVNPNLGLQTPDLGVDQVAIEANAKLLAGLKMQEDTLKQFNDNASQIITDNIANTFGQLGTSIGEALATGGNVLTAIGQTILQGLSNFLSDMGTELIKYGTLAVAKGKIDLAILAGGPVSIGAGVAAIAVGIALKAASGAIGAKAKGGAGGASSNTGGNSFQSSGGSNAGFSSTSSGGGTFVFRIAGQDLISVISNTLDKNSRLGGAIGI
jgi:hypothetical protein